MLLKKIDHATGVDTSDLDAKKILLLEDGKSNIKKLVNVPSSLNDLKQK